MIYYNHLPCPSYHYQWPKNQKEEKRWLSKTIIDLAQNNTTSAVILRHVEGRRDQPRNQLVRRLTTERLRNQLESTKRSRWLDGRRGKPRNQWFDGTKSKTTLATISGERGHARRHCPQRDKKQAREPLTEHLFDDDLHHSHGVQENDETRKFYSK